MKVPFMDIVIGSISSEHWALPMPQSPIVFPIFVDGNALGVKILCW